MSGVAAVVVGRGVGTIGASEDEVCCEMVGGDLSGEFTAGDGDERGR